MNTLNLSRVTLFAALIAALGFIPPVAIPLAFGLVILFLLLGMPLLSDGRGGLGVFVSPSARFLFSWLPVYFTTGLLFQVLPLRLGVTGRAFIASVVVCINCIYSFGNIGLVIIAKLTPLKALPGSVMFIPGDLIKAGLAAVTSAQLVRARPGLYMHRGQS